MLEVLPQPSEHAPEAAAYPGRGQVEERGDLIRLEVGGVAQRNESTIRGSQPTKGIGEVEAVDVVCSLVGWIEVREAQLDDRAPAATGDELACLVGRNRDEPSARARDLVAAGVGVSLKGVLSVSVSVSAYGMAVPLAAGVAPGQTIPEPMPPKPVSTQFSVSATVLYAIG